MSNKSTPTETLYSYLADQHHRYSEPYCGVVMGKMKCSCGLDEARDALEKTDEKLNWFNKRCSWYQKELYKARNEDREDE